MPINPIVTLDVLDGYLSCKYKGRLRLAGQAGHKSDYEMMLIESRQELKLKAVEKIHSQYPEHAIAMGCALTLSTLKRGPLFILDANLEEIGFSVHFDGLMKVDGDSDLGGFYYLPVLFYAGCQVHKAQRILLEMLGLLLSRVQGKAPSSGIIYHGSECTARIVRFSPNLKAAETLLDEITRVQRGEVAPNLWLNDHCNVCEFRTQCHAQAIKEDNLSLLRGLGEKEIKNYGRKGLFTLTQLAHTFRPRRKGKRSERGSKHRYHALQALAIRDKTIYLLGAPTCPSRRSADLFGHGGQPRGGIRLPDRDDCLRCRRRASLLILGRQ